MDCIGAVTLFPSWREEENFSFGCFLLKSRPSPFSEGDSGGDSDPLLLHDAHSNSREQRARQQEHSRAEYLSQLFHMLLSTWGLVIILSGWHTWLFSGTPKEQYRASAIMYSSVIICFVRARFSLKRKCSKSCTVYRIVQEMSSFLLNPTIFLAS